MQFSYSYRIERVDDDALLVTFPDVPGANTEVREGEDVEAVARDCLVAALGAFIVRKRQPPSPSAPNGKPAITLDLVTSAKLALATAMAEQGVTNVELASRLGVDEKVVRRLLDPDHRCRIDRLESALALLGHRLELVVRAHHDAPRVRGEAPLPQRS